MTDVYEVPEGGITSVEPAPTEFQEYLTYMEQSNASQNFSTWFEEYRNNAEITVNPMPEGLPYAIDLTPYEEAAAQNAEGDAAATEGTEETGGRRGDVRRGSGRCRRRRCRCGRRRGRCGRGWCWMPLPTDQAGDTAAADQAVDEAAADQTAPPTRLALTLPPTRLLPIRPRGRRGYQQ